MLDTPVKYSPAVEEMQDNESDVIAQLNESLDTILDRTASDNGRALRAVHAKAHGILEGVLHIENLPAELSQGMFKQPGDHKVYLRFSTNAGDILPDSVSLPRGLAIKVLDVEGERLAGAEGTTQDFVMVNSPVFQAKTAEKFGANLKLLAKTTDRGEDAKVALSSVLRGVNKALTAVGVESTTIQSMGGAPNVDPLGETYYSVTSFRYGEYIAKFSLAPLSSTLRARTGVEIDATEKPDAIREHIREAMSRLDGVWELRVQLCRDLAKQPVEDPTKQWDEQEAPFVRVATISVSHQNSWNPESVKAVDEGMRFSVWTGLVAHQPLGNINRARRATYEHSSKFREHFNGCPIHEPIVTPEQSRPL